MPLSGLEIEIAASAPMAAFELMHPGGPHHEVWPFGSNSKAHPRPGHQLSLGRRCFGSRGDFGRASDKAEIKVSTLLIDRDLGKCALIMRFFPVRRP
jgi:hypothetical protein